jgi:RNA polymerase primary sigma factor
MGRFLDLHRREVKASVHKVLSIQELDQRLDDLARQPDAFGARARILAEQLDAEGSDLEIRASSAWRRPSQVAPRMTSFVHQFQADVDSILPLDREEEARLARRIEFARIRVGLAQQSHRDKSGSSEETRCEANRLARRATELHALRSEMVERNLYLVLINVERYAQAGAIRLDLIQEGCVSLFRAVDGFDWRRGLLFRTYAVHWLNQAFRNYLYNHGHTVRVPVYLQKALKHVNQALNRLGDPRASSEAIAIQSGLDENLVASAIAAARASYSIDVEGSEDREGLRFRDVLVDSREAGPYTPRLESLSLERGISRALEALNERERLILRLRFGLDGGREHTLSEVAGRLNVSVERVRQLQVRALSKLDTPGLRRDLEPFLN